MSSKKPSTVKGFKVVREFRGTRVYLVSVHAGKGMRWLADASKAMVIPDAQDALAVSERANREWGAKVTVVDTSDAPHLVERSKLVGKIAVLRSNGARFAIDTATDALITLNGWSGQITVTPRDFAIRYEVQS